MRKFFSLLGVMLLFVGALAHAPPVNVDPDVTVEFLADNLDADYDIMTTDAIQITEVDQVALPLTFEVTCLPEVTLSADPGTLDVNYLENTNLIATQENVVCQLKLCNEVTTSYTSYTLNNLNTEKLPFAHYGVPFVEWGCL